MRFLRNGTFPATAVNKRWSQSSAITATMEGDLMSPEGTQEGKEYLSSRSYQTATTPQGRTLRKLRT